MIDIIDKVMKYLWILLFALTLIVMVNDLSFRISIFPAEYICTNDYLLIIFMAIIYYFARKREMRVVKNMALAGFMMSLINKFGFMIGSILMW